MDFQQLLRFAVDNHASDLHIQAGSAPMLRVAGQTRFVNADPLNNDQVRGFVHALMPSARREDAAAAIVNGLDFAYSAPEIGRFRCSAYSHLGQFGIVLRIILPKILNIEQLNLPEAIRDVALSQRGLTLVTGTTNCGKSSTLAAMIELINENYRSKIIAVEDPVEYVYANKKSMVSQLEVGVDTPSFEQALRQALRQNPDVILVGELRDVETLRIALRAADTGHQVFSTLHSANATQTIERIIAMFPPNEHELLLSQLASSVEAIVSQRLVTGLDGSRRPAVEILRGGPVTEKFILQKRLTELHTYIETNESGMQSFNQHLLRMYQGQVISGTEALRAASNPEALGMAMRGIQRVGVKRPTDGKEVKLEKVDGPRRV